MPLTKREAAIVAAYTGYHIGDFAEMQKYAEEKLGHPIFTHQFADKVIVEKLKAAALHDFVSLKVIDDPKPCREFTDEEKADMRYHSQ